MADWSRAKIEIRKKSSKSHKAAAASVGKSFIFKIFIQKYFRNKLILVFFTRFAYLNSQFSTLCRTIFIDLKLQK